jgi:hypothetical protein
VVFRRLLSRKKSDGGEYDRVVKLVGEVAACQKKTDEQISKSQKKTDGQLRSLINYNQNRDHELEEVIEETLMKKLRDQNWAMSKVDFTEIVRPDGRNLLEWDGIIQGANRITGKKILLVIETKQVFTADKLDNFKVRFLKMKNAMEKAQVYDDLYPFKHFLLCGAVAAPVFREDVDPSGFTCITLKEDQYEVSLESSIL